MTKAEKNQIEADRLHKMDLSKFAERIIDSTDIDVMEECFGGMNREEVEAYILEHYLDDELMDTIGSYMNDEIRESLHGDIDNAADFLREYVKRDPDFAELLENEWGIEL